MLVKLQGSAPHLLHLKLSVDVPPYSPLIISAVSSALGSFKHLVSARTGLLPITQEALHHLAELPHLEAIDVRLPDAMAEQDVEPLHPTRFDQVFPALRELQLVHRFNLAPIRHIVQHVQSSRLEIIHVVVLEMSVPLDTVLSFLSAALDRSNRDDIKELVIQTSVEHAGPESHFTAQHLEPLFALRSLTNLGLRLSCIFDLSDALLGRAARAWPDIRVLELGPASAQRDTEVTLAALVPFAQHCPKLQTLGFTLDTDLARLPAELREPGSVGGVEPQRTLWVLKVGCSRIADPEGVAAFLVDLFPCLGYILDDNLSPLALALAQGGGPPPGAVAVGDAECHKRWRTVYEKCLPALARARGIDRGWSLDQTEAHIMKAWHIGGRRRQVTVG